MMLLVDGLAGDPERLGDGLPRPPETASVVHVQFLEFVDQPTQRRHRPEPDRRVAAVHCVVQADQLLRIVSLD